MRRCKLAAVGVECYYIIVTVQNNEIKRKNHFFEFADGKVFVGCVYGCLWFGDQSSVTVLDVAKVFEAFYHLDWLAVNESGAMRGGEFIVGVEYELFHLGDIKEEVIVCAPLREVSNGLLVGCDLVCKEGEYGCIRVLKPFDKTE